ncbi:ABC transporter ATP-binding protein [Vallitalea longa]|uniref:ABC transporter ATP-binding protein n=1 Tax=Vallitalea longa TaxID=2936439 RepID=A0A9W6DH27_9FIRM|nr:ABC transporter ATP-binding protein [Vallitalea longa]GKX32235.1 ABC transporter ATP-binding protein [Vallitalea longa]
MKICIKNLNKKYGKKHVLDNINLELENGMHGLLGPNGAGKTTLMRILTTLLTKTSGEITYNGINVDNKKAVRKIIGYLPQEFSLYPNMSVYETLEYFYLLSDIKPTKAKVLSSLRKVHLDSCKKLKIKALSGGMKRRLGIAIALINNPEVLIVDEPTAGLDPEERIRFRNLLSDLSKDKVIILSTHIVEDIALTCSSLTVIKEGNIKYNGKVSDFIRIGKGKVFKLPVSIDKLNEIKDRYVIVSTVLDEDMAYLKIISDTKPEGAETVNPTLEDSYMILMQEVDVNVIEIG